MVRPAPFGLELLEPHHAVDPAIEKRRGFLPTFTLVIEPCEQGRPVDRAESYPLRVIVEVGAGIAVLFISCRGRTG